MQCASTILSSVSPLYNIFPFFSLTARFSKKKKKLMSTKYVFWFSLQLLSEIFLILRRIQWDVIINVQTSSYKIPVIWVRLERNLNFPEIFLKNIQIPNFMKICPVGAKLFYAGVLTDDGQIWRNSQSLFAILLTHIIIEDIRYLTTDAAEQSFGGKGWRKEWISSCY